MAMGSSEFELASFGVITRVAAFVGWGTRMGLAGDQDGLEGVPEVCEVARLRGEQSDGDGEVRMERIAALRRAIESGSYNVSADEIAEKLMERMLR